MINFAPIFVNFPPTNMLCSKMSDYTGCAGKLANDKFVRSTSYPLIDYNLKKCLVDIDGNPLNDLINDNDFVNNLGLRLNQYKIPQEDFLEYMQFRGADLGTETINDLDFIYNTIVSYSPFNAMNLSLMEKSDIVDAMGNSDSSSIIKIIRSGDKNNYLLNQLEPVIQADATMMSNYYNVQRDFYENKKIRELNGKSNKFEKIPPYEILRLNNRQVPVFISDYNKYTGQISKNDIFNLLKSNLITFETLKSNIDFSRMNGYDKTLSIDLYNANGNKVEIDLGASVKDLIEKLTKNKEELSSNEIHALTDWLKKMVKVDKNTGNVKDLGPLEPLLKDEKIIEKARVVKGMINSLKTNNSEYMVDDHFYMRMLDRNLTRVSTEDGIILKGKDVVEYCAKQIIDHGEKVSKGAQSEYNLILNDQIVTCKYAFDENRGKLKLETIIAD